MLSDLKVFVKDKKDCIIGLELQQIFNRPLSLLVPSQLASVAVNYSGYWFYIDRTDQRTKKAFGTLRTLLIE